MRPKLVKRFCALRGSCTWSRALQCEGLTVTGKQNTQLSAAPSVWVTPRRCHGPELRRLGKSGRLPPSRRLPSAPRPAGLTSHANGPAIRGCVEPSWAARITLRRVFRSTRRGETSSLTAAVGLATAGRALAEPAGLPAAHGPSTPAARTRLVRPPPPPPRFSCTPEPRKAALLRLVAASVGDRRSFGTSHGPGRALASVCCVGRAAARHASTSLRGQARVPVPPHPGWHAPFRSRGSRTRDLPPAPTTARGSSRLVRSRLGRAGAATVTTVICAVVKRGHRSYSGETKPP